MPENLQSRKMLSSDHAKICLKKGHPQISPMMQIEKFQSA
jgi:hypothetical protein